MDPHCRIAERAGFTSQARCFAAGASGIEWSGCGCGPEFARSGEYLTINGAVYELGHEVVRFHAPTLDAFRTFAAEYPLTPGVLSTGSGTGI